MRFEEQLRKSRHNVHALSKAARRPKKRDAVVTSSFNIDEFRKIDVFYLHLQYLFSHNTLKKLRDDTSARRNENLQQIIQMQQELNQNTQMLDQLDSEINSLKLKKTEIRLELKRLYLSMLKNERQLL